MGQGASEPQGKEQVQVRLKPDTTYAISTEADTTYQDVPDATYGCAQEPKGMPASSAGSLERGASVR
jgi:hypothetical protein